MNNDIELEGSLIGKMYVAGTRGYSAYEVAVQEGFDGTEEEWLESLIGPEGPIGQDGKSAYQVAVDNGYIGTQQDWVNDFLSPDGYYNKATMDNKLNDYVEKSNIVDNTITNDSTKPLSAKQGKLLKDDLSITEGKVATLEDEISSLSNGSPLPANDVSDMTDTTRMYVNVSNGYLYYYDGNNWVQGNMYQSAVNNDDVNNELNVVGYKLITGYYVNSAGVVTSGGSTRCITDKIPLTKGTTVSVKGESNSSSISFCTFYDEQNQPIQTHINSGNTNVFYSFTAPDGTCYMIVSSKTNITTAISIGDKTLMNEKVIENVVNNEENRKNIELIINSLTNGKTNNLFNVKYALDNYDINSTTGLAQTTTGNYFVSPFIPVIVGKTLYVTADLTNYNFRRIAAYDKNYKMIADSYTTSATSYTVPINAEYIRFSSSLDYKDTLMVTYDSNKPYEKYGFVSNSDLTIYVDKTGSDSNEGTKDKPLLTIGKALSKNPYKIIVNTGTYNESLNLTNNIIIVGNGNVIISGTTGNLVRANGIQVELYNLKITGSSTNNVYLINCIGKLENCESYNAGYNGFRLDGSNITLTNCKSHNNTNDGFGAHDTELNSSRGVYINCSAYLNGDDGLSYHEESEMYVDGGEYYNNDSGITPFGHCKAQIQNTIIKNNTVGLNCFNSVDTIVGHCNSFNNLIIENSYPYRASYYTITSVNDVVVNNTNNELISNGVINHYKSL